MRHTKKKWQILANLLEIPQDIVLDLPRITMLGNKQLLIENHKGIIEYSSCLIRIKLNQGMLKVQGEDLSLGSLQAEQILVDGMITLIKYDV